jgi:hypothetical protein
MIIGVGLVRYLDPGPWASIRLQTDGPTWGAFHSFSLREADYSEATQFHRSLSTVRSFNAGDTLRVTTFGNETSFIFNRVVLVVEELSDLP